MKVIQAKDLSKVYRIYDKPVHRLVEGLLRKPFHKEFYALDGVNFQVDKGSTLGIIGDNGAGKSTLLKILARTLSPTKGDLFLKGRVSALLELGAGFHSELTGRQNIFLNASLLGLSEQEIHDREDSIVQFADIGKFIDRPVKTYSSGMTVRLGFSIATSVDPDILIIDEAISVGDQRFQEKCIERMQDFRNGGKTLIICSHSMYIINKLSQNCIWLDSGRINQYGPTREVVSSYLSAVDKPVEVNKSKNIESNSSEVIIENITVVGQEGKHANRINQFDPMVIEIQTRCIKESFRGHLAVVLIAEGNKQLFSAFTKDSSSTAIFFSRRQKVVLRIPELILQCSRIKIKALITDEYGLRLVYEEVTQNEVQIVSEHPEYGLVWMQHEWEL